MFNHIEISEQGGLELEGRALLVGDLIEVNLLDGDVCFDESFIKIGQIELISGEYQVTLFNSDWGRLIITPPDKKFRLPCARRLADRWTFIPPFGVPFPPGPHPTIYPRIDENGDIYFEEIEPDDE